MKIAYSLVKCIAVFSLVAVLLLTGMVTAFATEAKVAVTFDSKGGSMVSTMEGVSGTALNLPNPKRDGYIFAGWYNKSGDKLFTDIVFPDKKTELYAKWDIRGGYEGFENVEAFDTPGSLPFTVRCKLTTEDAASGTTSLLYDYHTVDNATMALATVSFIDDCGLTYTFTNDVEYILTFKYKVVSVSKPGNFGVISSANLAPWRKRIEQVSNYDKIGFSAEDIGKGWQTKTIKFTANDMEKDAEYFGFAISGCGKLYVDDILIRVDDKNSEYKGHVIEFESNGGAFIPPIYGKAGDSITIPEEIEKEGYNFVGWYADKDLIHEFEETTFVRSNTVVYADWFVKSKPQAPTGNTGSEIGNSSSEVGSEDEGQQTIVPDSSKPSDNEPLDEKQFDMTVVYIIIAAVGALVVVGVVIVIVTSKAKAKAAYSAKAEKNDAANDDKEAK